jgi:hypothetical protein
MLPASSFRRALHAAMQRRSVEPHALLRRDAIVDIEGA